MLPASVAGQGMYCTSGAVCVRETFRASSDRASRVNTTPLARNGAQVHAHNTYGVRLITPGNQRKNSIPRTFQNPERNSERRAGMH